MEYCLSIEWISDLSNIDFVGFGLVASLGGVYKRDTKKRDNRVAISLYRISLEVLHHALAGLCAVVRFKQIDFFATRARC